MRSKAFLSSRTWLLSSALALIGASCSKITDTNFAPQYSEVGFSKVLTGDDSNRVSELIGLPMRIDQQSYSIQWIYRINVQSGVQRKTLLGEDDLIPFGGVLITFDTNGLVRQCYGTKGMEGKSMDTILSTFGSPAEIKTNTDRIIYNYTTKRHSDHFEVRAIFFDRNGRVSGKTNFYYRG
jgi:hypothetical protein